MTIVTERRKVEEEYGVFVNKNKIIDCFGQLFIFLVPTKPKVPLTVRCWICTLFQAATLMTPLDPYSLSSTFVYAFPEYFGYCYFCFFLFFFGCKKVIFFSFFFFSLISMPMEIEMPRIDKCLMKVRVNLIKGNGKYFVLENDKFTIKKNTSVVQKKL